MGYNKSMAENDTRAEAENQSMRGKLKLFLGYAAGVGKTYAMLEAAHQRRAEGVDCVVGFVDTHGRKETEALLVGLECIANVQMEYHGARWVEMDLDAVLARHPRLVLVDELAHSNVPGSRHPKRYQNVDEILAAGIDVYSTVNIQHMESLNDVVRQITGVVVQETIPDRLLDEATEIELIDLPPDELLARLRDGKVYGAEQAARALENFFRKGNLTALREMALRRAADRVDSQMLNYMQAKAIPGPWPAGERILVCLSSHPMGERLIRAGRRLADDLNAEWFVLFVETPGHLQMPAENRARLERNQRLAEELGATVTHITGSAAAEIILDFAREHNITKIIAGRPARSRWHEVLRGSVIDRLMRNRGKFDVYIVSEETDTPQRAIPRYLIPHSPLWRYLVGALLVLMATCLAFLLRSFIAPPNLVMLFLVGVIGAAVYLGRGPSIFASFLSVFVFDFFFVDPHFSFSVNDTQYLLTFSGLLLVGLVISNSAALLRDQVEALRTREQQTLALNLLSKELTGAVSLQQVLEIVLRQVNEIFQGRSVILLPVAGQLADLSLLSPLEQAVAQWAFLHARAAGRGTDTLPAADIRAVPLVTARGTVGVLGVRLSGPQELISLAQRNLLDSYANLSALAIERASFAEKVAQSEMLRATEKLQTALLNSISHELRTPLASITGVLTSLGDSESTGQPETQLDPVTRLELINSATRQAQRLNLLVQNLLDMTRLEAGAMHLNREPGELPELVGTLLQQSPERFCDHPVQVVWPVDLPLVMMDAVLVAQVLTNLLDNACKYSPGGAPIKISAQAQTDQVEVTVADGGTGIPPEDLERIFDKFYRIRRQNPAPGTGLGLSICKGIVEAHGGKIWAQNIAGSGLAVRFTLPAQPTDGQV